MRELTIQDGFESLFFTCCLLQLLIPLLAIAIREQLKKYDITMGESPYFSVFKGSEFWHEATQINKKINDQKVKCLLLIRDSWFAIAIASFVVILIF